MHNIKDASKELKIIGYINPNRYSSSIISICSDKLDNIFSIYPNGDFYELKEFSLGKFSNLNFIRAKESVKFVPDKINYALSEESILYEVPEKLCEILFEHYLNEKSEFVKELVDDFINSHDFKRQLSLICQILV
ncbi:MAG: hypothetical protein IPN43_06235 [Chitinophagaceae bacterium]|nr:hypothetical protein [Chitinophagaceae bacterium]